MRRLLINALARCGVAAVCRRKWQRRAVTILVYHEIKPAILRKHLEAFKLYYNFIALSDYIGAIENGKLSDMPDYAMVITLDDGHASNFELVDIFNEFNIVPTIFLTSGLIGTRRHFWWKHCSDSVRCEKIKCLQNKDRLSALLDCDYSPDTEYDEIHALSMDELNEMSKTVDFQAHTITHPILTMCDDITAEKEISGCKSELEEKLGSTIYAFAYPNGSYSEREVEYVKAAGYKCALTVDGGFNKGETDPYKLKRLCVGDSDEAQKAILKACGLWQCLKQMVNKY